ncbi:MAG: ATP-binding protein [Pseudomonadota bacterium]
MISFLNALFLNTALLDALVAGLVFMVFRHERDRSASLWVWSCLLMATGMLLLTVRQHLPGVLSFGLVNGLMLYALVLQGHAIGLLLRPEHKPSRGPLLFCLAYGALMWGLSLLDLHRHLSLVASMAWASMHAYLFVSLRVGAGQIKNLYFQVFQYLLLAGCTLWLLRLLVVANHGIAMSTDAATANLLSLVTVHLVLIAQQISYLVVRLTNEKNQKELVDRLNLSLQKAWKDKQTVMAARQDERQQLMRDLHDGFGSKLASLRLLAQKQRVSVEQMAEYLKEVMADLHLFADTLCHDEVTLEQALVDMRYRTESRHADGVPQLHWELYLSDLPALDARTTLHVLRVLQEAMHNAIRHANAQKIGLRVAYSPGMDRLTVSVRDDGVGMPEHIRQGQGLNSMQQRAREIGANIVWLRRQAGTVVLLTLERLQERVVEGSSALDFDPVGHQG